MNKKGFLDELFEEIGIGEERVNTCRKNIKNEKEKKEFYEEEISDVIVDAVLDQILNLKYDLTVKDKMITTNTLGEMFPTLENPINYEISVKVVTKLYLIFKNTPVSFWYRIPKQDDMIWSANIALVKKDNKYSKYYGDGKSMILSELPIKRVDEMSYIYMYELLCFGNIYKYFEEYYYDMLQKKEYQKSSSRKKVKKLPISTT